MNDTLTVNTSTNALLNGSVGNDQLIGGPGNDTLDGCTGSDVLSGRGGRDTATYTPRTSSQPVVVSIDGLANDGQASEADNVKTDTGNLIGGAGNDTLTGSTGPNRIDGGLGADSINGLGGADAVNYVTRTASQAVTVKLDNVANDSQAGEGDNVNVDVEDIMGGAGNDSLSAAANTVVNVLTGGLGDDKLKTHDGTITSDRVICGTGVDQFDIDPDDVESGDCETPAVLP